MKEYSKFIFDLDYTLLIPDWSKEDDFLRKFIPLEKHENIFGEVFDVDINAQDQKGVLKVSSIERMSNITFVKLLKK